MLVRHSLAPPTLVLDITESGPALGLLLSRQPLVFGLIGITEPERVKGYADKDTDFRLSIARLFPESVHTLFCLLLSLGRLLDL